MRAFLLGALALGAAAAEIAPEARRSGYDFAGPETRAMQDDDMANPGMLWVMQGEALWDKKSGAADRSCADCHGDARISTDVGSELYHRREGQLNLSCGQCHDDNWGKQLAGSPIPQGHPTGYPLYRLEWQSLGSLQRRLRNCMIGVRAEPYEYGAPEAVALELYLMERARGMPIETPAVRP